MKLGRGAALLFVCLFVFTPVFTTAQTPPDILGSTITIPEPISDFVKNLGNIDLGNVPLINDISKIADSANSGDSLNLSDVGGLWNSLNDWFSRHIGTSFSDIVRTIGNAMLWVLDLMGRLLKAGLSYLPGN